MFDMSRRLVEIRKEHHLTQKEMAKLAHMELRRYQTYEYGKPGSFPALNLYELAEALDISLDYFFERVKNPKAHHSEEKTSKPQIEKWMERIEKEIRVSAEKAELEAEARHKEVLDSIDSHYEQMIAEQGYIETMLKIRRRTKS